jgi:cold shock CspA family protein
MVLAHATGTVVEFDEHRGLGTIATVDGRTVGFHCTQIADGTRTIAIGADVEFDLAPGPLGRIEATAITPRR